MDRRSPGQQRSGSFGSRFGFWAKIWRGRNLTGRCSGGRSRARPGRWKRACAEPTPPPDRGFPRTIARCYPCLPHGRSLHDRVRGGSRACSSADRASASGAEGRRFESCRARQNICSMGPRSANSNAGQARSARLSAPSAAGHRRSRHSARRVSTQRSAKALGCPGFGRVDGPPCSTRRSRLYS